MVYKLVNIDDLQKIEITDRAQYKLIFNNLITLSEEYGTERNVDYDDGGYVLYAEKGTCSEDLKAYFDISKHIPEYAEKIAGSDTGAVFAVYLLDNEYTVTIFMSRDDAPIEIIKEIEEL